MSKTIKITVKKTRKAKKIMLFSALKEYSDISYEDIIEIS